MLPSLSVCATALKSSRRFPVPRVDVDRTGATKSRTLEFFVLYTGWNSAREFCLSPVAGEPLGIEFTKSVEMRLLRYERAGLLRRRRRKRGYEYSISMRGEERLVFLWERLGLLNPGTATTVEDKEVMRSRLRIASFLAKKHANERRAVRGGS